MKLRGLIGILLAGALPLIASAQSVTKSPTNEQYLPRLGDIMSNIQLRHIKLSFAGNGPELGTGGVRASSAQGRPGGSRRDV